MIVPINQHWRKKPGVLAPILSSSLPERHGHTATSSAKGQKYYQGLQHLMYKERMREQGGFSRKGKSQRCLHHLYRYVMEESTDDKQILFSVASSERTRGSGHKCKQRRMVKHKAKLVLLRMIKDWHMLPRNAVRSSSLEIFKIFMRC